MSLVRSLFISLSCVGLLPIAAATQGTAPLHRALGGGLVFQNDDDVTRRGVHVEGAYAFPLIGRRLEARLEGGVNYFPGSRIGIQCATANVCGGPANTMTVLRGGASLVIVEQVDAHGAFYWIAGVGVYRVTDRPVDDPFTRFGWNAGFGVRLGRSVYGEIRYHEASGTQAWRRLVPISFGWRF